MTTLPWRRAALSAILLGAAVLDAWPWQRDREDDANTYYAAVKSMLTSWHNSSSS